MSIIKTSFVRPLCFEVSSSIRINHRMKTKCRAIQPITHIGKFKFHNRVQISAWTLSENNKILCHDKFQRFTEITLNRFNLAYPKIIKIGQFLSLRKHLKLLEQ